MKSQPARRGYDASNRQAAAMLTREAIVSAAMLRLRAVRPEQLSYAELAESSGVALRTVYRHFPTLDDLLAAALQAFLAEISGPKPFNELTLPELADALEHLHAKLSAEPGMYRLFFTLPSRSGAGIAALVQRVCHEALARIPQAHHAAVCAAIELQLSPYAWEMFHTHWHVPPARITRAVLVSIQLLLDGFAANPRALAPTSPRPAAYRAATHRKRDLT